MVVVVAENREVSWFWSSYFTLTTIVHVVIVLLPDVFAAAAISLKGLMHWPESYAAFLPGSLWRMASE